jgi:hypothetical protein
MYLKFRKVLMAIWCPFYERVYLVLEPESRLQLHPPWRLCGDGVPEKGRSNNTDERHVVWVIQHVERVDRKGNGSAFDPILAQRELVREAQIKIEISRAMIGIARNSLRALSMLLEGIDWRRVERTWTPEVAV